MARAGHPVVQKRSRLNWRARFAKVEPVLQGEGFQYTFVIAYVLINAVLFVAGAAPEWRKAVALRKSVAARLAICAARGGGALLNVNSALVVLVAARKLMTFLRATPLNMVVPFDKAMPHFHQLIGHVLVASAAVHVLGHVLNYSLNKLWSPGFHGYASLLGSGVLITLVLVAIRVTVLPRIRKAHFEVFYYTHIAGFVLYYGFLILHGSHNGVLSSWRFVVLPLAIYFVDRLARLWAENVARLEIAQSTGRIISGNVVCLRLRRAFHYKPGQYADIKVPAVSNVEWHPFTIASSPHESEMLFFIKNTGDWTSKLYDLFANPPEMDGDDINLQVHVRGPFGAPAQHVGQYEHVVLIGGGVGATPFASIAKYAHNWILDYTERGARIGVSASKNVSAAFAHSQSVAHANADGVQPPATSAKNLFADSEPPPDIGAQAGGPSSRRLIRNVSSRLGLAGSSSRQGISRSSSAVHGNPLNGNSLSGSYNPAHAEPALEQGMYLPDRTQNASSGGAPLSRGHGSRNGALGGHASLMGSAGGGSFAPVHSSGFLDRSASSAASQGFLFDSVGTVDSNASDYPEGLGDPDAPLVSQNSNGALYNSASSSGYTGNGGLYNSASASSAYMDDQPTSGRSFHGRMRNGRHELEVVREYDSEQDLFASDDDLDDDDEDDDDFQPPVSTSSAQADVVKKRPRGRKAGFRPGSRGVSGGRSGPSSRPLDHVSIPMQTDADIRQEEDSGSTTHSMEGWEYENRLLRDMPLESNAANLMGVSFGSTAMMRHMASGDRKFDNGMRRASMNVMDEALDAAIWEERALFYLHTVTVNWFLLWVMLLRYSLTILDGIINGFQIYQRGLAVFDTPSLIAVDLGLALLLAFPVNFAVALELRLHGISAFFSDSYGNVFDILLLVPLSAGCVALSILALLGIGDDVQHVSKVTLLLFWPTMSLLLLWRIARTVGPRIMLAQYLNATQAHTKSLDFIFVSRMHSDDQWLVKEMLPLTSAKIVRLHRYITKDDEQGEPELWAQDHEYRPLETTYRRPHFDDVFAGIAARSKSGSVIGVFYCCPPSMGHSIQQGAMKAMAKSLAKAYKCGYMQAMSNGGNGSNLSEGARYGCAVKFALREENFG